MAIKYQGSGKFTYNLDVQAQKPLDSRLVVASYENDLAGEKYKLTFVLDGANAWYDGMLVYAEDTKKVYVLKGSEGFVEVGFDLIADAELSDTTYEFTSATVAGKGTDEEGNEIDIQVPVESGAYFTVTEEGKESQTIYVNADTAGTAQTLVAAEAARAAGEEARIEGLVTAEKGRAEGVEAGLQAAINTLNGADTVSGSVAKAVKDAKDSLLGGATTLTDFAKVETAIADAEAAAKAAASVVVEGTDEGNNLSIVPTTGENGATTYTVNLTDVASATKVATLIGEDTDKSVRTIANEELAKQLIAEGAAESLDTLQEIAQWIQDHPDDASAMNEAITQLQKDVDAIEADYLTDTDKTELTGAIATAKGEAIDAASKNTAAAIADLNATVGNQTVAEGKHVAVEVVETAGKLTGLTIVESDIASAADLATLDAEVQEHEQVVAGALNDLNDRLVAAEGSVANHETRLTTAEGEIDALQTAVEGINVGVTKVTGDTTNTFVKVSATPETGDVALGVQVAVQDGATAGTKLATDTYVAEQSAAAVTTAAADATSKANTAESNAKTYADNLMSWVVF